MRALLSLAFCVLLAASASAQSFPSRQIRMIVPAPPAGITDLSARLVAEGLRVKFNQPVIVENKPGGNGVIGVRELLKAEPDGYTLLVGAMGKARPGKLTFGSTGTAALDYLAVELFMKETGTKMVHVPYRGGPAALNDLMGGSIDLLIEVYPVVMEQIKTGLVKGLAVSSPYRLPSLPNVPTFKQAGVAGVELTGWLGIYGPPRMPSDARVVLGKAIADIVKQGDIEDKFRAIGFEPTGPGVEAFSEFHASEVKRWIAFMTEIGLRK